MIWRFCDLSQAAFKALANNQTEDGSGPILGVIRTNGFGITLGEHKKGNAFGIHSAVSTIYLE